MGAAQQCATLHIYATQQWLQQHAGKVSNILTLAGSACMRHASPCAAGALERAGISPAAVQEVFMGNVCSANLGQVCCRLCRSTLCPSATYQSAA
jgi:hypothetical protein